MRSGKKGDLGQVAVEYLLLVGVVFFTITIILYYSIEQSNQSIKMNKAKDVVSTLSKTADIVYVLGPGSQDYVEIDMPGNVQQVIISGKEISLKLKIFGNVSDVFARTKANVTGNLTIREGSRHVSVKTLESGIVEISE